MMTDAETIAWVNAFANAMRTDGPYINAAFRADTVVNDMRSNILASASTNPNDEKLLKEINAKEKLISERIELLDKLKQLYKLLIWMRGEGSDGVDFNYYIDLLSPYA